MGVHISLDVHILKTQEIAYMDDSKKIQTRREFFKKAARGMLPIFGAIVLSGTPVASYTKESHPMGCKNDACRGGCENYCARGCDRACEDNCSGTCEGCQGNCYGDCVGNCKETCQGGCQNSCSGSCSDSCAGSSKQ